MPDLIINCRDCNFAFTCTEAEQESLKQRAIAKDWERCEPPKRCKACRDKRRGMFATSIGFDVLNEQDAFKAWREGYFTIYAGSIAIHEANEYKFVKFIMELIVKGEKVRAVTKMAFAEREVTNRETNRVW
jgi:hypothetical protein